MINLREYFNNVCVYLMVFAGTSVVCFGRVSASTIRVCGEAPKPVEGGATQRSFGNSREANISTRSSGNVIYRNILSIFDDRHG